MRALITGAGGFAGRHLARHLAECGDEVLGLERTASADGGLPNIAWDLTQELSEAAGCKIEGFSPEAIYHLAAISIPADCRNDKAAAHAVNVEGTRRVLALAESLRPAPRVLVVSSGQVYAAIQTDSPVVNEDAALKPANFYGETKLAAERTAERAAGRGLPVIVARAFNHTGPGQSSRLMLPEWCRKFARGDDPVVVQCRDAWLDLIDVRDVVRAYRLLLSGGQAGQSYNVGGGIPRRSGDLLDRLAELADPQRRIREEQPGGRQQAIADISRLVKATGWQPQIDMDTTIADTLADWQARVANDPEA